VPYNGTGSECAEKCFASDCEKCLEKETCAWGATGCVDETGVESYCPAPCGDFSDCASCLSTSDCHWSVTLQECLNPLHQPLYCAGGACGLVLRGGQISVCPEPCDASKQCSTCLRLAFFPFLSRVGVRRLRLNLINIVEFSSAKMGQVGVSGAR